VGTEFQGAVKGTSESSFLLRGVVLSNVSATLCLLGEETYFFVERTVSELAIPLNSVISLGDVALDLRMGGSEGFAAGNVCASARLVVAC
jgi:hypothetical protein